MPPNREERFPSSQASCSQLTDIHSAVHTLAAEVKRLEANSAGAAIGDQSTGDVQGAKEDRPQQQQQQQQKDLAALRAEVLRLQQAAEASTKADLALGSLQKRLKENPDCPEGKHKDYV